MRCLIWFDVALLDMLSVVYGVVVIVVKYFSNIIYLYI